MLDRLHFPERELLTETIAFRYEGSELSQLREENLPPPLLEFKGFLEGVMSLELLSPERLRRRTRDGATSIGRGGKHLTALLDELGPAGRQHLASWLKRAF